MEVAFPLSSVKFTEPGEAAGAALRLL
jgi:hypothetical protein